MPYLSPTLVTVFLPSGVKAVYEVQPQHLPREEIPGSSEWPRFYGRQIAHQHGARWYKAGGWDEVDARTAALLDRVPDA